MNSTGPHGTPRKRPAATAETTTEKTTEDKLREECARLRADNRALRRAEARRQFPPSAALYGPRPTQSFQRTVKMHRQRHQQYEDVMHRLDEYRSHVDRLRRDRGYESEHHHDG